MAVARAMRINVLGPRGGAKSTIGTLAFPLCAALEQWERYIWIVSDTRHQACAHLENIKNELLDNRRLAADYPDAVGRGPVWRAGAITLRNGVTIEAFGTGQRIRGRRRRAARPTLIVCDDLQNDGHMRSAAARERSRTWFHGTLLKAGTSRTNFLNLATALHRDALAMELCRNPGWDARVFRAIPAWPENMALWNAWETIYVDRDRPDARQAARAFYDEHRQEMEAGAEVLWPAQEDLYTLMCMRAEEGRPAFEREKQNSPISPELCEWPEEYFAPEIWFDHWPDAVRVRVMAIDPSKGSDARRGDYSACVMLAVDRQGVLYVEADLARRPTPQIVADGVELYRRFRPDALGIESNQFQELLAGEFEAEFRRQGLLAARPWPMENHVSKQVRIRRLGPYLASRRLRFKAGSPGTQLLVEQLTMFPVGDHDDGPDALEMAIRLAAEYLQQPRSLDGLGDRLPIEG
jgi:predicted phage terminase large subunit-like protein